MRSKDEQIMPGKDTTILARQDEKDEPLTGITDTTLLLPITMGRNKTN